MKYWWVNQNQTYQHEVAGGYMWSPKTKVDGSRNHFYDTMEKTAPGDVVFSFADTFIKAVGVVADACVSAPKPTEFGSTGPSWGNEGWYVPVEFTELATTLRPKDHMLALGPTLPSVYSPLQANGNGNQVVYLTEVPAAMAAVLSGLLGGQVEDIQAGMPTLQIAAAAEEQRVRSDTSIPETERMQLVKARVGQGLYRSRVELLEPRCRLTGITDKRMLRASHIKPWAVSDHIEKLDGENGLMLSPHVDHLFDAGFISFAADGALLTSPQVAGDLISAWHLAETQVRVPLRPAQSVYMAHHRSEIFRA